MGEAERTTRHVVELPGEWTANAPGTLGGTLSIAPGSFPVLQLIGRFGDSEEGWAFAGEEVGQVPYILGNAQDGDFWKKVSLLPAVEVSRTTASWGSSISRWTSKLAVVGAHCTDIERLRFSKFSVALTGMTSWLQESPFRVETTIDARGKAKLSGVEIALPPFDEVDIPSIHGSLALRHGISVDNGVEEVQLRYKPSIVLSFDEAITFPELLSHANTVQELVTLLCGLPASFESVTGVLGDNPDTEVSLYFSSSLPWHVKDFGLGRALLPHKWLRHAHSLGELAQRWFEVRESYGPTVAILVDNVFRNFTREVTYRDTELLDLSQVAEGLHRRVIDDSRQYRFRRRVTDLYESVSDFAEAFIYDKDEFTADITVARNRVAHRFVEEDGWSQTRWLLRNHQLRLLLNIFLLHRLEISGEFLETAIKNFRGTQEIRLHWKRLQTET